VSKLNPKIGSKIGPENGATKWEKTIALGPKLGLKIGPQNGTFFNCIIQK
jgi:hypothetical protein